MSIINSQPLIGASGQGGSYNLTKSLRFRSSASAYLNRTPASAGNRRTWTWSGWVKRGILSATSDRQVLFGGYGAGNDTDWFELGWGGSSDGYDKIYCTTNAYNASSTAVYRDPSAWYHIVYVVDTTQATQANRIKVYVNGSQITYDVSSYVPVASQNAQLGVNGAWNHNIAKSPSGSSRYFDGYLTEVNFIDGQALTPSSFGETSTSTGVWIPKKYTGTYGTNGFYLPFTDVATTSGSNAGLGKDFSGNGNYWTTNNISVTTGTTYDSMSDVPTLTSATVANYCTLNPLDKNTNLALSNGNLTAIPSSTADYWLGRATMQLPSTGKWYWELTLNNTPVIYQAGIYSANRPNSGDVSATGNEYQVQWGSGLTYIRYQSNNAAFANWGTNTNPTSGDVLMFAVDSDNARMWVGRNGTWYNTSGTANPATNTDPRFSSIPSGLFAGVNLPNPASGGVSMNFGQQGFAYTPPSGFVALNTFNLPTPTIGATASSQANKYFDINLWTGNSSARSFTNSGSMQPDFVWVKDRTTAGIWNVLFDSVRGAGNQLSSNQTDAELASASSIAGKVSAFNSDGFSVVTGSSSYYSVNQTGDSYVGWQWRANGTAVTNTAGSITSTVSANTTAGFSIVTYTGTGSNATVGHGLGVAPSFYVVKGRNLVTDWHCWHTSLGGGTYYIKLNQTGASATEPTLWNSTTPTSSVFSLGTAGGANNNGSTYVAYCFAQVAGYSAFGSYVGNGSADGPFIYTGFRPRYYILKNITNAQSWSVQDTARSPYNVGSAVLLPNSSLAELTGTDFVDILSNGFKIRHSSSGNNNNNGDTYIYMAFAENPFKYSLAR